MTESNVIHADYRVAQNCLNGDSESFRSFVQQFRDSVYRLSFRILRQHEDAEDVVQETFVRAFRSLHHWDQSRPIRPWLLTIAANRCRTALAKRKKSVVVGQRDTAEQSAVFDDVEQKRLELAEELQQRIDQLRPNFKECFLLFYRDQLSCAEIAERMNCPEGTVKTWLFRARQQLAESLSRTSNPNLTK